ncbi:Glucokinase [bacterium HR40]|nr:Glucokinase [bacterium HR40]
MRLIADIGGTYARLALQEEPGRWHELRVLEVAAFSGPSEAIDSYLAGRRVGEAVLAVATPVEGDLVRFTNSSWTFSQRALASELGIGRLAVINDFVAHALAIPHLAAADLEPIGAGKRIATGPAVVLGPGTGLGCAFLLQLDGQPHPVASEAGHMSFAPADEEECRLLSALAREHGHVSFERVLSGPGLVQSARALAALAGQRLELQHPAQVIERARLGRCLYCETALRMFSAALGGFAGDLALAVLARGGVFLVGALLEHLGDLFDRDRFRARFLAKGRLGPLLQEMATVRVRRSDTGLLGASHFAFAP